MEAGPRPEPRSAKLGLEQELVRHEGSGVVCMSAQLLAPLTRKMLRGGHTLTRDPYSV